MNGGRRWRRRLATGAVATLVLCGALPAHASSGLSLLAEAGLGGVGRPGRWVPVRITVANSGSDVAGEIVVDWGDAQLRRAVALAAPSQTSLELYVRTQDVRASVQVSLVANGQALASTDVGIRMIPDQESLVVCVGAGATVPAPDCTTIVGPEALPRSLRGYAAADDVRASRAHDARLTAEQQAALRRWRAYHALAVDGRLYQAPRASLTSLPSARRSRSLLVAVTSSSCSIAIGMSMWLWFRRGRVSHSYAALVGAIAVGVTGAMVAGRIGPGSTVVMTHATTVQQVGDGALVSVRGSLEYPAFDTYAIAMQPADGMLTVRAAPRSLPFTETIDGAPVRKGILGRGHREEVEIEAVADYAPFAVAADGEAVRVTNASALPLTGCRFPDGFSRTDVGTLPPGGSAEARVLEPGGAPFFSCLTESPVRFTDAKFDVRATGSTVVSVLLSLAVSGEAAP